MKVVANYNFNYGREKINDQYSNELSELIRAINNIDASLYKTKESKEKTMMGRILYSPSEINKAFQQQLLPLGWSNHRQECDYSLYGNYSDEYVLKQESIKNAYRDMDFVKNKLGVEVQFGKYAFMVYNVCAKMTIFKNLSIINAGIEIVPVKNFADQMSTGVSFFEQIAWDLSVRGVSNIDTPVFILGIDA